MSIYHDIILDHYQNPRYVGILARADIAVEDINVGCGDKVQFYIGTKRVKGKGAIIGKIKWQGTGCAISMAAASILAEMIQSTPYRLLDVLSITEQDMVMKLGGQISPTRMKCATLALAALKKGIHDANI